MISKETVEQIIAKNDAANRNKAPRTQIVAHNHEWSDEKKQLAEEIAVLPREELYDLVSLMACGRERITTGEHAPFQAVRQGIVASFGKKDSHHIAVYLLQKGTRLSEYLRSALPLL